MKKGICGMRAVGGIPTAWRKTQFYDGYAKNTQIDPENKASGRADQGLAGCVAIEKGEQVQKKGRNVFLLICRLLDIGGVWLFVWVFGAICKKAFRM